MVFLSIAVLALFSHKKDYYTKTIYGAFDTVCEITIYSSKDNLEDYEKTLRVLHSQLDVYNEQSLISKLNSGESITLTPDIAELLEQSQYYSKILSDYFDISINPLLERWSEAEKAQVMPNDLESHLGFVGIDSLYIDKENHTAKLSKNGTSISLGAIAKGFASEILCRQIENDGIESALINLGGNVYAHGKKPSGADWQIAITDPDNTASPLLSISVSDLAVVTSGAYERYYEINGKKYNHIINPKTGYPVENEIKSVTITATDSILCDVLSTAVYVSGISEAKALSEKFDAGIIIVTDDSIFITENLTEKINLCSDKYNLCQL